MEISHSASIRKLAFVVVPHGRVKTRVNKAAVPVPVPLFVAMVGIAVFVLRC